MSKRNIVIIPGDGIGPEITAAVIKIIDASGAEIAWVEHAAGLAALEKGMDVLPDETLEAIKEHKVALKGPCTTPIGEGFTSVNVKLRKTLDLYAAVRPVRNLPGVITRFRNVDIVVSDKIGRETITYVGNIYKYYIAYEMALERNKKKEAVRQAQGLE